MQCEKCNAPLDPKLSACPECGAPVPQNIEGFDNTMEFQHELRAIVVNDGTRAVANTDRFIGLLSDHVPDYGKECRLLINMYKMGVLKILLGDENHEIAIMKAKSFMLGDLFLAENASEFVIACYTYLLGWPYESHLKVVPEEKENEEKKPDTVRKRPVDVNEMVYMPRNAIRQRLQNHRKHNRKSI